MVLLLVGGMTADQAEAYALARGADAAEAAGLVADARHRLTIAAEVHRDEALGKAVRRLEDLYAKSIAGRDTRTALQAQRELNRLLGLYAYSVDPGRGTGDGGNDNERELARRMEIIEGYLLPLRLTGEDYPVEEHARLAAEIIRATGRRGVPQEHGAGEGPAIAADAGRPGDCPASSGE